MADTFWHKQTAEKPLFPDLLWSRPESRQARGKLLIIGGNSHGFAAPAAAYAAAEAAGIGTARVLLPDSLRKLMTAVQGSTLYSEFAPSTPSGSFAKSSLAEWLDQAAWADGVLLAGDLGRNSETAILLESFLKKYTGQLTLTKDATDYALGMPRAVLERPDTLLVITTAGLQKLATAAKFDRPFRLGMDLLQLVENLHLFTQKYSVKIITKHLENMLVATNGQVSTTKLDTDTDLWRVKTAATASTWWLQNPTKPFEALSTSVCTK